MYCTKCGTQNAENAWKCVKCGAELRPAAAAAPQPVRIPNYLVHAILCTLFCCLPLGIVAIVYAAQVNSKAAAGDIAGAQAASDKAKLYSWWSFGLGAAVIVIYIVLMMLGAIAG
jgi:uncharacterized membrane protein YvbJ